MTNTKEVSADEIHFLCNSAMYRFRYFGEEACTVWHHYLAHLFPVDSAPHKQILRAPSLRCARKLFEQYEQVTLKLDNEQKIALMKAIIREKVDSFTEIKRFLLDNRAINMQYSHTSDAFWGNASTIGSVGANHLGRIWMEIQNDLKKEKTQSKL